MCVMKLLDLITSEARVRILHELFSETNKHLYVRELTRRVGTEINAVRRELKRLAQAGLIRKERRGNRLYYLLRKDYIFYNDLASIVAKETGIGKEIIDNQASLGKIKLALLSKDYIEGREPQENQLDLIVVGSVNLEVMDSLIKKAKIKTERDVNYTVMGEEEFIYLRDRKDHFLLSFLVSPNILLLGDENKYLTLV
jgi:DNA-binding transcriptional ArsR family regulator